MADNTSFTIGSKGPHIKSLTKALNDAGFDCKITDKFDKDTAEAVKAFQKKNGIKPDGVVGLVTAKKLGARDVIAALDKLARQSAAEEEAKEAPKELSQKELQEIVREAAEIAAGKIVTGDIAKAKIPVKYVESILFMWASTAGAKDLERPMRNMKAQLLDKSTKPKAVQELANTMIDYSPMGGLHAWLQGADSMKNIFGAIEKHVASAGLDKKFLNDVWIEYRDKFKTEHSALLSNSLSEAIKQTVYTATEASHIGEKMVENVISDSAFKKNLQEIIDQIKDREAAREAAEKTAEAISKIDIKATFREAAGIAAGGFTSDRIGQVPAKVIEDTLFTWATTCGWGSLAHLFNNVKAGLVDESTKDKAMQEIANLIRVHSPLLGYNKWTGANYRKLIKPEIEEYLAKAGLDKKLAEDVFNELYSSNGDFVALLLTKAPEKALPKTASTATSIDAIGAEIIKLIISDPAFKKNVQAIVDRYKAEEKQGKK